MGVDQLIQGHLRYQFISLYWWFVILYRQEDGYMDDETNELEVAKKYCEFCEVIE